MSEIRSMDYKAYREEPGVSKSMLDDIAPSPWKGCAEKYHAKHIAKTVPPEETDALKFGSLAHRVVLEPDSLDGAYHVRPDGLSFTTKEGKAWRDAHGDRPIITHDEWTRASAVRDAVWKHREARALLTNAQREKSLFATDKDGTLRKGRLDLIPAGTDCLADLKTCESAALGDHERDSLQYRYFVQAAYYLDLAQMIGLEFDKFAFICVEKTPPYLVAVYQVDPEILDLGRTFYRRDLAEVQSCTETGIWPGYKTQMAGLPAWAKKQMQEVAA